MLSTLNKLLLKLTTKALLPINNYFYGFIAGHDYIGNLSLIRLRRVVGKNSSKINRKFEQKFAKLIGPGDAVSFASGRMAFYALLKSFGIGPGDEVILPGFTCSVMVNAILRTGAKPVYSDIDTATYGSYLEGIEKVFSANTKIIVAQHSFGIPCDICPIVEFANRNGVFLIEDCALSVSSEKNGIRVGNFGNAAIFSTDHSKPINTLIGGLAYTGNSDLYKKLRAQELVADEISLNMQRLLWFRFRIERLFYNPRTYKWINYLNLILKLISLIYPIRDSYLKDNTNLISIKNISYEYPARLPSFLAYLGLIEINRWAKQVNVRSNNFEMARKVLEKFSYSISFPDAYFDSTVKIIPLRFVWLDSDATLFKNKIRDIVDTQWIWFMSPIVGSDISIDEFQYNRGSCANSESVGKQIINIPCNISQIDFTNLLTMIEKIYTINVE